MRILLDVKRCEGHGVCAETAPELFRLDDDGELVVLFDGDEIPAGQEDASASAVRVCPVGALRRQP